MATKYYEDVINKAGLETVKSEDLQKKFDEATKAEYDKQRTELQNTENKFYNKLYDTQQTTMDTLRQSNASAVATGASRGIQAANELSALLGLQQESVESATDIANQATTIAQDETQAMLENVLTAEQEAQKANQALASILVQAGSVDVEGQNADTAAMQVQQQWQQLIEQIRLTNATLADKLQSAYNAYYSASNNKTENTTGNKTEDTTGNKTENTTNNKTESGTSMTPESSTDNKTGGGTNMTPDLSTKVPSAKGKQEVVFTSNSNGSHSAMRQQMMKEALKKAGYSGNIFGTDIPNGTILHFKSLPYGDQSSNRTATLDNVDLIYIGGKWYINK